MYTRTVDYFMRLPIDRIRRAPFDHVRLYPALRAEFQRQIKVYPYLQALKVKFCDIDTGMPVSTAYFDNKLLKAFEYV